MSGKFITYKECPMALMDRFIALNFYFEDIVKEETAIDVGLYTIDELSVLFELMNEEGLSQNELANSLHKNKSTIKRTVDKLEKKKAVIRQRDKSDSRKYNIFLGEESIKLKEKFLNCHKKDVAWFQECIGADEYEKFMQQLNFLYEKTWDYYKTKNKNRSVK